MKTKNKINRKWKNKIKENRIKSSPLFTTISSCKHGLEQQHHRFVMGFLIVIECLGLCMGFELGIEYYRLAVGF